MEEIARVYSEALFEVAKDKDKLDEIHEQLGQLADELGGNRDLQVFFFSPYLSSAEKREGLAKALVDADPELVNFLELLVDKHRMPALFRIRRRFDDMWAEENRRLEVTVTSAIELDPDVLKSLGEEVEKRTGHTVELNGEVDEGIVGGLVLQVGNRVLDASIRARLERLRKEVARAV